MGTLVRGTMGSELGQRNRRPGLGVAMHEYAKPAELTRRLDDRVHALVKVGFEPEDIAIVSCRGISSTALAGVGQISKYKLRRYTGQYDANNQQIYTDGQLNFETIFRFKGQQAHAVILVDLDETMERHDGVTGVLYCAMTPTTVRRGLVVSKG